MFGVFRTLLAILVVFGHLHGPFQIGTYAVFGFYMLSGYLMTFIMSNNYGYLLNGKIRFVINRILRIYPPYFAAALFSIVLLILFGNEITEFNSIIYIPRSFKQIFQNVFLIFPSGGSPRLSPPTWALTVELFFYVLICLGISRTKTITLIWVFSSLLYTIYIFHSLPNDWQARYFPIPLASLPFSIGALLFHFKKFFLHKIKKLKLGNPIFWFGVILLNFCVSFIVESKLNYMMIFSFGFYFNIVLMSFCILSLIQYESRFITKHIDQKIGNYSYPIYLVHWQSGAFVYSLSDGYLNSNLSNMRGFLFLAISSAVILIVSHIIIKVVDMPIEILRNKVKSGNKDLFKIKID